MTIKQKLEELKLREEAAAEEHHKQWLIRNKKESDEIKKARKMVLASLREYRPKATDYGVSVKIAHKIIYIVIEFVTDKVNYSDDTSSVDVRRLKIGLGYYTNGPRWYTDPRGFEDSFISFLRQEKLV